jgi:hypothetical protein
MNLRLIDVVWTGFIVFTPLVVFCWIRRLRFKPQTEISAERLAEIQSWLEKRITLEDANEMICRDQGIANAECNGISDWYAQHSLPEDELWFYNTPDEEWEALAGEDGFAIVRNGTVIDFLMYGEN